MKTELPDLARSQLEAMVDHLHELHRLTIEIDKRLVERLMALAQLPPEARELLSEWFVASRELHARSDAEVTRILGQKPKVNLN